VREIAETFTARRLTFVRFSRQKGFIFDFFQLKRQSEKNQPEHPHPLFFFFQSMYNTGTRKMTTIAPITHGDINMDVTPSKDSFDPAGQF
jgi:hypothetical protein